MSNDPWVTNSTMRRRVTETVRQRRENCVICRERIDYSLSYPNPRSFSVQHMQSRKARPDLIFDTLNCRAAHLDCNQSQGERAVIVEWVKSHRW